MWTFDQIEDARDSLRRGGDGQPALSLQQAAHNVGLSFEQCDECRGSGYTKATLLASMIEIEALMRINPNGALPIQYDRCIRCHGSGGWLCEGGSRNG
jgi:hypothetical protein